MTRIALGVLYVCKQLYSHKLRCRIYQIRSQFYNMYKALEVSINAPYYEKLCRINSSTVKWFLEPPLQRSKYVIYITTEYNVLVFHNVCCTEQTSVHGSMRPPCQILKRSDRHDATRRRFVNVISPLKTRVGLSRNVQLLLYPQMKSMQGPVVMQCRVL